MLWFEEQEGWKKEHGVVVTSTKYLYAGNQQHRYYLTMRGYNYGEKTPRCCWMHAPNRYSHADDKRDGRLGAIKRHERLWSIVIVGIHGESIVHWEAHDAVPRQVVQQERGWMGDRERTHPPVSRSIAPGSEELPWV